MKMMARCRTIKEGLLHYQGYLDSRTHENRIVEFLKDQNEESDLFYIYVYAKERKRSFDLTKSCSVNPIDFAGLETGTVNKNVEHRFPFRRFRRPRTWTEEYIVIITNKCILKFSKRLDMVTHAVNGERNDTGKIPHCYDVDLQHWMEIFSEHFGLLNRWCVSPCNKDGTPNEESKMSLFLTRHNISLVALENCGMPKLEMQWKISDCTQCYYQSPKTMVITVQSGHRMEAFTFCTETSAEEICKIISRILGKTNCPESPASLPNGRPPSANSNDSTGSITSTSTSSSKTLVAPPQILCVGTEGQYNLRVNSPNRPNLKLIIPKPDEITNKNELPILPRRTPTPNTPKRRTPQPPFSEKDTKPQIPDRLDVPKAPGKSQLQDKRSISSPNIHSLNNNVYNVQNIDKLCHHGGEWQRIYDVGNGSPTLLPPAVPPKTPGLTTPLPAPRSPVPFPRSTTPRSPFCTPKAPVPLPRTPQPPTTPALCFPKVTQEYIHTPTFKSTETINSITSEDEYVHDVWKQESDYDVYNVNLLCRGMSMKVEGEGRESVNYISRPFQYRPNRFSVHRSIEDLHFRKTMQKSGDEDYYYWSHAHVWCTLQRVLKRKPPKPDTLNLRKRQRAELCIRLYSKGDLIKNWKDLGGIIGLKLESIMTIEGFIQEHTIESAAEIVLRHWQAAYNKHNVNRDTCPHACTKEELLKILDSEEMDRQDLLDIFERDHS